MDTDGSMSPGDGLEKMRNDSESGDEFSSSSTTEHMQVRISDVHSPPCSSPTLSSLICSLSFSLTPKLTHVPPFISFRYFGFHSLHFQALILLPEMLSSPFHSVTVIIYFCNALFRQLLLD